MSACIFMYNCMWRLSALYCLRVTDFLFLVWIAAAPGVFFCLRLLKFSAVVEFIVNAIVDGARRLENVDTGPICSSWILCCFPGRV
jgi:hypothetical protein